LLRLAGSEEVRRWLESRVIVVSDLPPGPVRTPPTSITSAFENSACGSKMESDPNAVVRKRLHVAGLTPSVSTSDLSQRLGTFGTVIAVDGIGALDGLGRPRPFAYVTIEAKSSQLARCAYYLLVKSPMRAEYNRYESLERDDLEGVKASDR
jgi:hypothetical protein